MNEYALIRAMASHFPRSAQQLNQPFTADAELVRLGREVWAFTTDEFSAEEDGFSADDPVQLGANLGVATLHDLLAVGARPAFFLSAVVVPTGAPTPFALGLCAGLASVLNACGCHLLGGDLGSADAWRFTGTAFGPVTGAGVTRRLAVDTGELWVSGPLGGANAASLSGAPTPHFELRLELARSLDGVAVACIDTSGGLWDALHLLAQVNPTTRLEVELARIPLADGVAPVARAAGLPPVAALIGGAGEYELLFATGPEPRESAALTRLGATRIGTFRPAPTGGVYLAGHPDPAPPAPDARASPNRNAYLEAIAQIARRLQPGP